MREYIESKLKMNLQLFADAREVEGEGEEDPADDGEGSEGEGGSDNSLSELEKLQQQIDQMKQDHQKELDRYRNEKGKLKKRLEEIENESLSEEERLQKEKEKLESERKQLQVDKLETYKSKKIAEAKANLDYKSQLEKFGDFINITADTEKSAIDEAVDTLKSLEQSIRDNLLEELQDGGSIINSRKGDKGKKKVSSAVQKVVDKKKKQKENNSYEVKGW
jgi:Spy/CpxP family protein refolding chaperone